MNKYLSLPIALLLINSSYANNNNISTLSINPKPNYLYAQTAQSGTLQKDEDDNNYLITLQNVDKETIQFTDRPIRKAMPITTMDFIQRWAVGKNNFVADNPNGVLSYSDNQTLRTLDVVELSCPKYNAKKKVLIYRARPIEKNISLPDHIDMIQPSLFID